MNSVGLPKIPTDSFYKCAMFLGIIIVLAGSVSPITCYLKLNKQKNEYSGKIKVIEKKKEHLLGELDTLMRESEELTNTTREGLKETTFPKAIDRRKSQKSEIVKVNLDYVKEKIAFYKPKYDTSNVEFVYPKDSVANPSNKDHDPYQKVTHFPPTAITVTSLENRQGLSFLTFIENTVNDIESRLSKNLQEQREREYELIQVNKENERLLGLADNMKSKPFLILCVIICALGVFMAFWGGHNWLKREQRLQDKILEINANVANATKQQERQE